MSAEVRRNTRGREHKEVDGMAADYPLIRGFSLKTSGWQPDVSEGVEWGINFGEPWSGSLWFVIGHGSGEARPTMLVRLTTMCLTPLDPCPVQEDTRALIAPHLRTAVRISTEAQAGGS